MLILALIHLVSGGLSLGKKSIYDPGVLSWSEKLWCLSPITISESNAGSTVSMSFSFHTLSSVSSGVFCVEFPGTFSDSLKCQSISSFSADSDYTVTFTDLDLPSTAGPHGPFVVYTASSSTGNIIDLNKNFGYIWLYDSYTEVSSGLSLALGSSEVQTSTEIIFTFSITTSLWANDYFSLSFPSNFQVTSEKCNSLTEVLASKNSDTSDLPCSVTGSLLFIYGNLKEIEASEASPVELSIKVSTFTTPSSTVLKANMNWTLKTLRYGTQQVLQAFNTDGPILNYKSLTVQSWAPVVSKSVTKGCSGYLTLTFTLDLKVPKEGSINFAFNNLDLSALAWKSDESQTSDSGTVGFFYLDPKISADCEISEDGDGLICTATDDISAGSYYLVTFPDLDETPATVIVTTTDENSLSIQVSESFTLTYSTANQLTSASVKFASDNSGSYTADSASQVIGYIKFKSPVDLSVGDVVKITLPISSKVNSDLQIGIISSLKANTYVGSDDVDNYGVKTLTQNENPTLNSKTLSVKMISTATSSQNVYIYLSSDNSASSAGLNLPYVSSNELTQYEFSISITKDTEEYILSGPLTIAPSSFASFTGSVLCTSTFAGLPYSVSVTPKFDYSQSNGLYISTIFTGYGTDLGSGLSIGATYPVSSSLTGVSFVLESGGVRMQGLKQVKSSTTYDFSFPVGFAYSGTNPVTVSLFYLVSGVKFVIMSDTDSNTLVSLGSKAFSSDTEAKILVNGVDTTAEVSTDVSIKFNLVYSTGYTTGYLGVILPSGFTLTSPSVTLFSDSSKVATLKHYFSDSQVKFPSIYFELSSVIKVSTDKSIYYKLSGVKTPTGSITEEELFFVLASTSAGSQCIRAGSTTNTVLSTNAKSFTSATFTPNSLKARGPSSLLTEVKALLKLPTEIPQGSSLVFEVAWSLSNDYSFTISGISSYVFSKSDDFLIFKSISKITSGSSISLTLSQVIVPESSGPSYQFSQISIFTDDSYSRTIVKYTHSDEVTINSATKNGISHFSSASVLPNGVGLQAEIVYLAFTLDSSLVKGSLIKIDSPTGSWLKTGDIKHYCFTSHLFSSCSINSDQVQITLAQNYSSGSSFEVMLDNCLELPSSSGNTAKGFTITTSYEDTVIDEDSSSAPSSMQKIKVHALPNETFYFSDPVAIVPSNEGELANYTFKFECEANIGLTHTLYISFPRTFDPFLGGEVLFKKGDPSKYYLNCSSTMKNLSNINCIVDHWTVMISDFSSNIENGTTVDISLQNIRNPSDVEGFSIYLLTRNSDLLAYNQSVPVSSLSSSANNTEVRSYSVSNSGLRQSGQSSLKVFLSPFSSDSQIILTFPIQYNLLRDKPSSLKCFASSNSVSFSGTCFISENSLFFPVGKASDKYELFSLTFTGYNPEWGDSEIPEIFSSSGREFWVNPLMVSVKNSQNITEKTFGQNRAFTGFNEEKILINVNDYQAKGQVNFLSLKPGVQLIDLQISVESPLKANSLILTPKNSAVNNATLNFDSDFNFTLTKDMTSITFSVSTQSNSKNSINFIEWEVTEDSLNGTLLYEVAAKTMVEVYELEDVSLSVSFGTEEYFVSKGTTGHLIKVSTLYPPSSDLTLSMSLLNSSLEGVTFIPESFTFQSGETEKFFAIRLSDNFTDVNQSGPYEFTFTQTGADSTAYKQLSVYEFYHDEFVNYQDPEILSLTFEEVTQNSMEVFIQVSAMAEVYWEFCDYDTSFDEYEDLVSKIYPLTSENSTNLKLQEQIETYLLGLRTNQKTNEKWSSFQKKMLAYNKATCFYSVQFIPDSKKTLLFSPFFLWAESNYKIKVYSKHPILSQTTNSTISQITKSMSNPIEITLKFTSSNSGKTSLFTSSLSQSLGVPSGRLDLKSSSRRLLLTSAVWVLHSDRSSVISPSDLFKNMDQDLFASLIKTDEFQLQSAQINRKDYPVPNGNLQVKDIASSYIVINGDVDSDGSVCCVAEVDDEISFALKNISAEQVYLGIDRENVNTMSNCTDIVTNWTIVVNGLNAATEYMISCVLISQFPSWPDYSDVYSFNVSTETYGSDFTSSSAVFLQLLMIFEFI